MADDWNVYTNTTTGISVDYPKDWGYEEDAAIGVVIFANEETLQNHEANPFAPIVNIITHKMPGMTLEMYSAQQLQRLRSMNPGGDMKVDRSASLGGFPAHKAIVRMQIDPTKSVQFFSIWTVHDEMCYSFFFHCDIQDFSKYQRVVTRMLTSFKTMKPKVKTVQLLSYVNDEHNFYFKYPVDWNVSERKGDKGPLVTISSNFKINDKSYHREVRVITQKRTGTLDEHLEKAKIEFNRMLVDKIFVEKTKVGSVDAQFITWSGDALEENGNYLQVLTYDPSDEKSSVIVLTLSTNSPAEDDFTQKVFDVIAHSFRFLSDPTVDKTKKNWATYEHLIYKFGMSYDPVTYVLKDEGIPLTEASFVHKDDQHVSIQTGQPSISFSVIVRQIPPNQKVNLKDMGKEIVENLRQVCGNSLEVLESQDMKLDGRPSRLIISKGTASSPTGEQVAEMYFVHKCVVDPDRQVAVLFAFASVPAKWKKEWANADSYISTLYWV